MDIDAIAKQMPALLAFKARVEQMIEGSAAADRPSLALSDIEELIAFKGQFEAAIPDLRKMVSDVSAVVDDLAAIKKDLAPALEWIAEKRKADGIAKATQLIDDNVKVAAKPAAASEVEKPLAHLAEVESAIPDPTEAAAEPQSEEAPAERSESEQPSG